MATNLPRESATWRALHGQERVEWDLSAQLLAEAVNALRILIWQQTKDGERGRNRPDPILPPWVEDERREVRKFGAEPVPLDELDDFLGWTAEMTGAAPLARPPQPRDSRGRFMRRP